MSELLGIQKWCERYKEKTGKEIHAEDVPLALALEDVMQGMMALTASVEYILTLQRAIDSRVTTLEKQNNEH